MQLTFRATSPFKINNKLVEKKEEIVHKLGNRSKRSVSKCSCDFFFLN